MKIHHVGIAVRSLSEASLRFGGLLGVPLCVFPARCVSCEVLFLIDGSAASGSVDLGRRLRRPPDPGQCHIAEVFGGGLVPVVFRLARRLKSTYYHYVHRLRSGGVWCLVCVVWSVRAAVG